MMRLSLRIIILCLIVSLGVGIGIGYVIEARQARALSSQIARQEEQLYVLSSEAEQHNEHVSALNSEIRSLTAEIARVAPDIAEKQASYDLLLAKHAATREQLATLQTSFTGLSQEYQALRGDYEALKEAANGVAVEELNRLREQVSLLENHNNQLQIQVARFTDQLTSALAEKQASYDLLLEKHDSVLGQLATLQTSFTGLSQEYQALRGDYEALQDARNGEAIEELNRLQARVSLLERENSLLHVQVGQLIDQLTPAPHHAVEGREIWGRPEFRSIAWAGRDHELLRKIEEIARTWHETHTFIEGETDCNDITVSLWNMLLTQGIKSVIVLGNLEMVGETFEEANHTWLYVFNARGEVIYLEPTTGEVFFGRFADGSVNPRAIPYREGFIYVKPSDLRRDLKGRW